MADRYTYLPLIGPVISLVWLTAEWAGTKLFSKILATTTTVVLLIACIILTRKQLWYWQDGVTLFDHTIAVAPGNPSTDLALGKSLEAQERLQEAAVHYQIAIALNPNDVNAQVSLGVLHMKLGHEREAAAQFRIGPAVASRFAAGIELSCVDAGDLPGCAPATMQGGKIGRTGV